MDEEVLKDFKGWENLLDAYFDDEDDDNEIEGQQGEAEASSCTGSCASCGTGCGSKTPSYAKKTFAVIGGKGGTGKSVITCLLACALAKKGYSVGILDADIANPAMPRLFGLSKLADAVLDKVAPVTVNENVKFISMGNIEEKPEEPILWGGADMAKGALYFWTDVLWGKPDLILIDMPSGLGDMPLTLYTTLPLDGSIVVAEPSALSDYVTKKSVNLARMLMVPPLGVVINKTQADCPGCGCGVSLGTAAKEHAETLGLELLAEVPYGAGIAVHADMGDIANAECPQLQPLVERLAEIIRSSENETQQTAEKETQPV